MLQICESSRSKPAGTFTAGITLTVNTIRLSHDYKQLSLLLTPSIPFSQAKASAWSKMCSFLCTNNCCQEVGPSLDQRGFFSLAACGKGNFLQSLSLSQYQAFFYSFKLTLKNNHTVIQDPDQQRQKKKIGYVHNNSVKCTNWHILNDSLVTEGREKKSI